MKNENIYKLMEEITNYIPKVFNDETVLRNHLIFMRYFSDFEWFNILAILYQLPNAKNVRTTSAWSKLFRSDLYPKKGQRGIQTFLPIYHNEMCDWKIVKVFDITQMQTTIKPQYASYLQMMVNSIDKKHIVNGEKGWQNQLILNSMKGLKCFKLLNKNELNFAMNCVLTACGDLLGVSIDVISGLSLTCLEINNPFLLYKFIKDIIAKLPEQLQSYVEVMEARDKQKKDIAETLYLLRMNIKENIKYAQNIVNNRLQTVTDGCSAVTVDEENKGLPLNTIISEEEIYKGDL